MILLYVHNICQHESKVLIKTASTQLLDSLWTTYFLFSFTITGYIFPQHNRTCSPKIYISIFRYFWLCDISHVHSKHIDNQSVSFYFISKVV